MVRSIRRRFWNRISPVRSLPEAIQNLGDSRTTDIQEAGECGPAFELARIQERLVIPSQSQWIAVGFRWFRLTVFGCRRGVPGVEFDGRRLT